MKPAPLDIDLYRGDDFELFFRIREKTWDSVNEVWVTGGYVDITGWVGTAQARVSEDAVEVLVQFTVTPGDQVASPGSCFVTLTSAQTAALTFSEAKWDLQFLKSDGKTDTIFRGKVTVDKDITRPTP